MFAMHNAVYPLKQEWQDIPRPDHKGKEKVVTFLGRITMQKGPEYLSRLPIWCCIVLAMCVSVWLVPVI